MSESWCSCRHRCPRQVGGGLIYLFQVSSNITNLKLHTHTHTHTHGLACSCARLGFDAEKRPCLCLQVGDDIFGRDTIENFKKNHIATGKQGSVTTGRLCSVASSVGFSVRHLLFYAMALSTFLSTTITAVFMSFLHQWKVTRCHLSAVYIVFLPPNLA